MRRAIYIIMDEGVEGKGVCMRAFVHSRKVWFAMVACMHCIEWLCLLMPL